MVLSSKTFPTSSSIHHILPEHQTSETIKPNLMDLKATIINHNSCNINSKNHKLGSSNSDEMNFPSGSDYSKITDDFQIEHGKKLKSFKYMLMSKEGEDAFQSLAIIDAIQRLGIEYHFQEEIDAILRSHYMIPSAHNHSDLYEVALRFRLLRQEGYYVSEDVFGIFKDKEGKFKQEIRDDIKGLMGLYDASQLSTEGEDILDEAADFSYQILNSWVTRLDYPQSKAVENTLKHPHYKSLPKFMAKSFISNLQGSINGWNNELQELAKFDFKIVQSQHQQEILRISKWWTELGLSDGMKFARNQPLKWYIWSMTALTDPTLSHQRVDLVKPISFVYMIDDIFDVFGTLNDLTLFTEVVDRWDINATDQLPECMKICFKALNNFTNEISYKVYKQHGWNPVDSLRKKWGSLCNAFLVEAKWFASGNLPNAEEYLKNGIVSSGVHVVLVHLFFLLGEDITKENVEFVNGNPSIISSTAKILRLWDDLGSAKDENQDGHDGSYLECYLKEHQESSVENARKHVLQMISETWKQLNKECLFQNPFSPTFTKACLNVARMVPLMYSYDDNHHLPILEEHINSLLCASVSI